MKYNKNNFVNVSHVLENNSGLLTLRIYDPGSFPSYEAALSDAPVAPLRGELLCGSTPVLSDAIILLFEDGEGIGEIHGLRSEFGIRPPKTFKFAVSDECAGKPLLSGIAHGEGETPQTLGTHVCISEWYDATALELFKTAESDMRSLQPKLVLLSRLLTYAMANEHSATCVFPPSMLMVEQGVNYKTMDTGFCPFVIKPHADDRASMDLRDSILLTLYELFFRSEEYPLEQYQADVIELGELTDVDHSYETFHAAICKAAKTRKISDSVARSLGRPDEREITLHNEIIVLAVRVAIENSPYSLLDNIHARKHKALNSINKIVMSLHDSVTTAPTYPDQSNFRNDIDELINEYIKDAYWKGIATEYLSSCSNSTHDNYHDNCDTKDDSTLIVKRGASL